LVFQIGAVNEVLFNTLFNHGRNDTVCPRQKGNLGGIKSGFEPGQPVGCDFHHIKAARRQGAQF
jgi:hypothetical protein